MVGDIGQPSHCIDTCFYVCVFVSIHTIGYVRYYTVVAYDICVIITLYQYAYSTIL